MASMGRIDPSTRMMNCLSKLQDQLERMAQLQSESVLTISKLSNAVLQISCELSEIKERLNSLEMQQRPARRLSAGGSLLGNGLLNSVIPENPPLTASINPASLASDALDDMLGNGLMTRPARVLVVEDDVAYQWLVTKHLEARGIECVLANTAQDALAKLSQPLGGGTGRFDLILMDIQLPGGASGLDITQRIRTFDPNTPIVSMTSSITPRQIASYLAGGMNDVLPKPFSKDGLLSLVCRFCNLSLDAKGTGKGPIEEVFTDEILASSSSLGSAVSVKNAVSRGTNAGEVPLSAKKTFIFTPLI